jgi:hypothetical protein
MLAIMNLFHGPRNQIPSFIYAKSISRGISDQFANFQVDKLFSYSSYLVFIFLFYQNTYLAHLGPDKVNKESLPYRSLIGYLGLKKMFKVFTSANYINELMYPAFSIIKDAR